MYTGNMKNEVLTNIVMGLRKENPEVKAIRVENDLRKVAFWVRLSDGIEVDISLTASDITDIRNTYCDCSKHKFVNAAIGIMSARLRNKIISMVTYPVCVTDDRIDYAKKRVMPWIISVKGNEELLRQIPHKRMLDFAIIYRMVIVDDFEKEISIQIDHSNTTLNDRELFSSALKNVEKSIIFSSLDSIFENANYPYDLESICKSNENRPEDTLYVLSNSYGRHGAALIISPVVLKRVADRLNDNIYILPRSVHECLILSANTQIEVDVMKELLTTDDYEDLFLSDNIYLYDRITGNIRIV